MLRNRFVLSLVGVGVGAIVTVAFLIFTGKIVTRNYPTSTAPVVTVPVAK